MLSLALVALLQAPLDPVASEPYPHLRTSSVEARILVEVAHRRSPTARRLIHDLARTDVVVYLDVRRDPNLRGGTTTLVDGSTRYRYLMTAIDASHEPATLIAMLGHELEHALEIARDRTVRDQIGMRDLYRRIGVQVAGPDHFETRRATETGIRIGREVAGPDRRRQIIRVLRMSKWRHPR